GRRLRPPGIRADAQTRGCHVAHEPGFLRAAARRGRGDSTDRMSTRGRDIVARGAAAVCLLLALTLTQARAEPVAEFYKGKQINVIVGTSAGGGYNLYARLLAHHIGRYIPGNPAIVVQNMPGAGGLRAANYLYSVAPKDGTT